MSQRKLYIVNWYKNMNPRVHSLDDQSDTTDCIYVGLYLSNFSLKCTWFSQIKTRATRLAATSPGLVIRHATRHSYAIVDLLLEWRTPQHALFLESHLLAGGLYGVIICTSSRVESRVCICWVHTRRPYLQRSLIVSRRFRGALTKAARASWSRQPLALFWVALLPLNAPRHPQSSQKTRSLSIDTRG